MKKIFSVLILCIALTSPVLAARTYNEMAVDFPVDGGAMLMYSRLWYLSKYVHAGFVAGGGQIENDFKLSVPNTGDLDASTSSTILPYIGPRIGFFFPYVGLSIGYGAFFAKSNLKVNWPDGSHLTGTKSGWGSGFYSPLLVLDFYDSRHNLIWGFGLGGFLGSSFPTMEASNGATRVTTNASPIDSLTFHLQISWTEHSHLFRSASSDADDF